MARRTRSGRRQPPGRPGAEPEPVAARKAGGVAWALTVLGTVLVVAGVVLRAAEVQRWPLGNMYEFAVVGAMFVLVSYCAVGHPP